MKSRCNLVVESPLKIANTLCCVGFPPGMMNIGRTLVSTKVEYAAFWKVRHTVGGKYRMENKVCESSWPTVQPPTALSYPGMPSPLTAWPGNGM